MDMSCAIIERRKSNLGGRGRDGEDRLESVQPFLDVATCFSNTFLLRADGRSHHRVNEGTTNRENVVRLLASGDV